jgi:hypothetical protein
LSTAVNLFVYIPFALALIVVSSAAGVPNVITPAPATFVQL